MEFSEILIKAAQLILSLSILIVLHELGHFIPAKYFKTRVEKFYLFFDPWFSLFKKKVGDTEYGVGWLPLGGYVKISGMIDESMDKEQLKKDPEPWEFRAKPAWQRLIIMIGGVAVNVVLGIFIYSMTLYSYGDKYLPNKNLEDGVWFVNDDLKKIGFKNGDKIISIDGQPIEKFGFVRENLPLAKKVTVERGGRTKEIPIPENFIEKLITGKRSLFLYPRIPTIVAEVKKGSSAEKSGLLKKDKIIEINGARVDYFDQFKDSLKSLKGKRVNITVDRGGVEKKMVVSVGNDGTIGFFPGIPNLSDLEEMGVCKLETQEFGFFESFPAGYNKAIYKLGWYIDQFMLILKPSSGAYKGLGGFKAIGNLFPPTWNWQLFWEWTAFLSLMLAFMNLLPIPALDGGHVMFLLYEIIAGKPAPEKVMEYAQIAGMILLLSLLVFANANDFFNFF